VDLILTGGKVLTCDPGFRIAQAVAIGGEKILAVGSDAEISALATEPTRRIDVKGRTVIPGLIDGHAHMDNEGLKTIYPSLNGCKSIRDVQERIAAIAKTKPAGEWIVTMPIGTPPYYRDGADSLAEKRYPTRQELDEAAPDHPVYIKPILGYWRGLGGFALVSVANSRALKVAGIGKETLPPWGGIQIDKDPGSGEPTGVFREWTQISIVEMTMMRAAPSFRLEDRAPALRRSMAAYSGFGTTSVVETHGVMQEVMDTYRALEQAGESKVRAHLFVSPAWGTAKPEDIAGMLRELCGWCTGRGSGTDKVRIGGVYTRMGGEGGDSAIRAEHKAYRNFSGYAPDSEVPRELVREVVIEAARMGLRISTLYSDCLELYEEANKVKPIGELRWIMSHMRQLTPDQIARIKDLGVLVTTQTNRWIADQGSALKARLGPGREDEIVPLRRLKDAGVTFGLGTDNTPISLFHPLWHVVARRNTRTGDPVAPAQKLSREEALQACTMGGAHLTFEEGIKGSLEPGKLADLAVLSDDFLGVDEDRIKELRSVLTVVGGKIVHNENVIRSHS
jgi:predicted amidohydrolase YtcJ